jgi:hypothetical protein
MPSTAGSSMPLGSSLAKPAASMIEGAATRAVNDTGLPAVSRPAVKRVTDAGR